MSHYLTILVYFLMTLLSPRYLRANETSLQLLGPREGHPSSIVDGSTAAAIRSELATCGKVFVRIHSNKGRVMINALEKCLRNNSTARSGDRAAAENIILVRKVREPFNAYELNKEMYVPIYDIQGNVGCLLDPERRKIQESYRYSAFGEEEIYHHRDRKTHQSGVSNPLLWLNP